MSDSVRLTGKAREEIKRLYGYLLDRDEQAAGHALDTIGKAVTVLESFPFSCRHAPGENSFLRQLVIPFGSSGYVALFEIEDSETATILAVRHQREDDYH